MNGDAEALRLTMDKVIQREIVVTIDRWDCLSRY